MNGLLDRFASVLERRFLLVAFLPVLIFVVALTSVAAVAAGESTELLTAWSRFPPSVQIVSILSSLALVWLLAGFVDSQLRNLTQLFEGYPLQAVAPKLAARAAAWHVARQRELSPVLPVSPPPDVKNKITDEDLAETAKQSLNTNGRYAEELFVLYPEDSDAILPTRLGNIIRAAEDYSESRYGADYLVVWPRLAHLCSERFVQDYELVRANVDFLLVVSFLSALFGFLGGSIVLIYSGPVALFLASVLFGFGLAHLSYSSAVSAAVEYGEQIRASVDLYRLDLLRQLKFRQPSNVLEETAIWSEFDDFLRKGHPRRSNYVFTPRSTDAAPGA
ncbi:MAG: hypothetical protein ACRDTC_18500 [Pseudonocardiaceae bacterium]